VSHGPVPASPSTRRLAGELNVELREVPQAALQGLSLLKMSKNLPKNKRVKQKKSRTSLKRLQTSQMKINPEKQTCSVACSTAA
jgi:hypothetical protein